MDLSLPRASLVRVSAVLATGRPDRLAAALAHAATVCEAAEVEEVLLQSYLFLGYPAALGALAAWRDVTGQAAADGASDAWEEWIPRGERVCRAVYGRQYEELRANVRRLHPDMERWMVEEGYGKVLGRPGLDLATRELCIAALLAVLDAPRQLYSHLRGALNVGAHEGEVARALEIAAAEGDAEARARTFRTWASVRERSGSGA